MIQREVRDEALARYVLRRRLHRETLRLRFQAPGDTHPTEYTRTVWPVENEPQGRTEMDCRP